MVIISVFWCCLFEFMAVNVVWTFWVRARSHVKWFIPGVSWSGSVLHWAEVIPSPCTPPLPSGSELWGRRSPHSPSHGKMPSSPTRDGTVLPISLTHQQWPRCMPLEDRHYKTTGDCSGFGMSKVVIRNAKLLIMVTFGYKKTSSLYLLKRTSTRKYYYYKTRRTNNKSYKINSYKIILLVIIIKC